ncbi:MAG TPA: hypothetical protein PLO51_00170, partial [Candidatus Micrarchaeota archaeon]|nr:hypothetical protein [Candidatus Micrarchaeota archaeon]
EALTKLSGEQVKYSKLEGAQLISTALKDISESGNMSLAVTIVGSLHGFCDKSANLQDSRLSDSIMSATASLGHYSSLNSELTNYMTKLGSDPSALIDLKETGFGRLIASYSEARDTTDQKLSDSQRKSLVSDINAYGKQLSDINAQVEEKSDEIAKRYAPLKAQKDEITSQIAK